MSEKRILEYDVETTGVQPYSGHTVFMHQFGTPEGEVAVYGESDDDRDYVQEWFNRVGPDKEFTHIRAWNGKFDRAFAENMGYTPPGDGCWIDGMISAHAINENRSVALKSVSNEVLGQGADDLQKQVKTWLTMERARRKKEATENGTELIEPNYSDVPYGLMRDYAVEDIHLTRKVGNVYDPLVERSDDLRGIVEFEHKVFDALYAVEKRGFPVDEQGYRRLEVEIMENLETIEDDLQRLASVGIEKDALEDFVFNPKSSKQILMALQRRGADLSYVTADSMDAENLRTVDDELAAKVLEFRSEFKALSTYVRPMIEKSYETSLRSWKMPFIAPDGRIHAFYRQLGTKTGRMSCSDPNIQNQPRDDLRLRYNFRAEPGYCLVACDLSNIEMRVFAAYAGEGKLLDAINNGHDLHTMTAEFAGLQDRARSGGHMESARQRGKMLNFSIVYGGGIKTISKQMRCSRDEARLILRRYHDAYPEVGRLQARIQYRLEDSGYIKSIMGRRFRIDSRDAYRAVNYLVQGSSADLLKAALVRLHAEGIPVVALVHDEIVAHCKIEDAERVKAAIERAMTDHPVITDKVPLEAEGEILHRWSEAKDPDFVPRWAKELESA